MVDRIPWVCNVFSSNPTNHQDTTEPGIDTGYPTISKYLRRKDNPRKNARFFGLKKTIDLKIKIVLPGYFFCTFLIRRLSKAVGIVGFEMINLSTR